MDLREQVEMLMQRVYEMADTLLLQAELIASQERRLSSLEIDNAAMRRDHAAALASGIKPLKKGRDPKMDPVAKLALKRHVMAHARASKAVGDGKGAVRSERVQRRLQRGLERTRQVMTRDEQNTIDTSQTDPRKTRT
jgi:hypothetical protein